MSLQIHLLGQTRITREGKAVDLPGYRPLALLAYLLLTRKAYRREHLIDLLFDGPDDPRAALRWTLSKLRTAIGAEYILSDRDEVAFNFQSDYWLDVSAFEAGETELYRGDFLEGLYLRDALRFEDWLSFERQRLRSKYQASLEAQLETHKSQGDHAAVVITAQQLLKLDHLREDWHYALISAFARLGKRAAALEQYEKCRQLLRKEWGVDPAPETAALAEAIRSGRIGAERPPLGSDIDADEAMTAARAPVAEPVGSPQIRHRPGLSRPVGMLFGAISLVVVFIFASGRIFNRKSPPPDQTDLPSASSSPSPVESSSADLVGKTVWVLGPFVDQQAKLFTQSMAPFEERTGIDVVFLSAETGYDLDVSARLDSKDPPDIIRIPQPSWLEDLTEAGKIIDIGTFLDDAYLQQQYPETFLSLTRVDGRTMGIWHLAFLKSLVWYPKQAFEAKGYEVPETWDELIALSDQIVADGGTPWCIGMEALEFTGWLGTDWVEDIMLRTAPPETYDAWAKGNLPFNSPEVRRAFEIMGQIWLNDEYVYGGRSNIVSESVFDNPAHLFEDPPGCYLLRQGSFAPYFFPPGVSHGEDYDFFYLPPIDPEFGKPALGSGDLFVMVNDRPEVRELIRYLTTAEATKELIKVGGFLSPNRSTPLEWFPTEADLRLAQIVLGADAYRFDASDLMPVEVGLGSFYRGIVDWVQGTDLDTVLQEIDASWPR